jgi:hypothetical protein
MIEITIPVHRIPAIHEMASGAEVGGSSNVRNREDRKASLPMDQLIGQLCVYAFNVYWFGDVRWWVVDRWYRNQFRFNGDGGYDVPMMRIDVKGSLMRYGPDPERYHLVVPENERHPNWIYVCALAKKPADEIRDPWRIFLTGWAEDSELKSKWEGPGLEDLIGKYILGYKKLHRLPPFGWDHANAR